LSHLSTGTCAHCGGHFIPTVRDEPSRTWCGACPEGQPELSPANSGRRHGFRRKGDVPGHLGTARACGKCSKWFAARPRETVCDGCIPAEKRTLRALKAPPGTAPRTPLSRGGKRAGQQGVKTGVREVISDYLSLTFRCPVNDPRAARLECLALAYEEAPRQRWDGGRTPVMPEPVPRLNRLPEPFWRHPIPYDPFLGVPPSFDEWKAAQERQDNPEPVPTCPHGPMERKIARQGFRYSGFYECSRKSNHCGIVSVPDSRVFHEWAAESGPQDQE
jgi:hypothetical protein